MEIDRDVPLEIWKAKNDEILNLSFLECFKTHCLGLSFKKGPLMGPGWVKKGTLTSGMSHVPNFVKCLPRERWAVNSLIIMKNYWIQGIELFQKLYIGLEYMVPKDIGKSFKINKVVRDFCKFSQRVKTVTIMNKNCKYPRVEGKSL